ncbi:unnamed protein product [Penicillium pancosmium]
MPSKSGSNGVFCYRNFDIQGLCRRDRVHYDRVFHVLAIPNNILPRGVSTGLSSFHSKTEYDGYSELHIRETSCQKNRRKSYLQAKLPRYDTSKLIATFQFRRYTTTASSDNEIGVPFILMSEAPGRPLSNFWKASDAFQPCLETAKKAKILSQLGAIIWKLSQLRFDKIGSLFEEAGSFELKECLSRGHMVHDRYFLISALSDQAEALRLSPHCFVAPLPFPDEYRSDMQYKEAMDLWNDFMTVGEKINSATNRVDYVVVADALRNILGSSNYQLSTQELSPCITPT